MSWRHDSDGYLYICDNAEHIPNTPDIAQRLLITEFKMATTKLEVEKTIKRCEMAPRFQRLPHIFGHTRLGYDSVDIVRRRPTTEIQDDGHRNRK